MYKKIFLLSPLFLLFLMAETKAIDAEECHFQGKSFSGTSTIDQECYLSQKISGDELYEKKVRGEKSIFEGNQNILWVTGSQDLKPRPIAGEKSLLHHILAISLSSDEKLLAVLDKNSEERKILIFGSHLSGHIKPYYTFDFPELDKAKALSFNPTTTIIFFITSEKERHGLYSFELYKDKRYGPLSLEKLIDPVDLTQSGDYLFVLDRTKKVHLYTNELKWVSTIEIGAEELSNPNSIRYSMKDQTLYVSNKQGDTIHYIVD